MISSVSPVNVTWLLSATETVRVSAPPLLMMMSPAPATTGSLKVSVMRLVGTATALSAGRVRTRVGGTASLRVVNARSIIGESAPEATPRKAPAGSRRV